MAKPDPSRFKMINWYPPMIGAGIRVIDTAADFTSITVEMKLRWWNKNIVGTQFGGSLYMMCDPFYMAILMMKLGPDYIVWDKAASIRFLKPGRKAVRAIFHIPSEEIARVKLEADTRGKLDADYEVDVVDTDGVIVAKVNKTLYVRRKDLRRPEA